MSSRKLILNRLELDVILDECDAVGDCDNNTYVE